MPVRRVVLATSIRLASTRTASLATRKQVFREHLASLQQKDPERWTTHALAHHFQTPLENVAAALALHELEHDAGGPLDADFEQLAHDAEEYLEDEDADPLAQFYEKKSSSSAGEADDTFYDREVEDAAAAAASATSVSRPSTRMRSKHSLRQSRSASGGGLGSRRERRRGTERGIARGHREPDRRGARRSGDAGAGDGAGSGEERCRSGRRGRRAGARAAHPLRCAGCGCPAPLPEKAAEPGSTLFFLVCSTSLPRPRLLALLPARRRRRHPHPAANRGNSTRLSTRQTRSGGIDRCWTPRKA